MLKKLLVFAFCSIFLCGQVFSLDPGKGVTQYIIEKWDIQSGLPQGSVHAVIQTNDGYLWLGTEEGLARFNGVEFTVFDDDNTPSITSNYILCLYEDSQENLWIGTLGGGLLKYKNGTFTAFSQNQGLSSNVVYAICEDSNRHLWIGTDEGGLGRWDGKTKSLTLYKKEDGLPDNVIRVIYEDNKGNLWIGTPRGLGCFKNNRFIRYPGKSGFESCNTVSEDSENNLWIGTSHGLYQFKKGTFIPFKMRNDDTVYKILRIFQDRDKNIWIASQGGGLTRYHNGKFSRLSKQDGLLSDTVLCITEDREGSLWIGTAYGGLNCLKDGKFITITTKEGLSDDVVFSVYEDSRGYMWFGTNNGLDRYKNGIFKHFTSKDGLSHDVVDTIFEDSSGLIWVGTDSGLNCLRNSPPGISVLDYYLKDQYIPSVIQDKAGNIWVGTLNGVTKLRDRKIIRYLGQEDGLANDYVTLVYEDSQGGLWFCTLRGGITRYKDGQFTLYTTEHGLAADTTHCIYEDAEAVLWIGTNDGLSRFKNGKFTTYTKRNGLFHNNIYYILEDQEGNLWMSTNKGIFTVRKRDLHDFAEGRSTGFASVVYGQEDGMRTNECNGGYQSAGCKTKDGKLWFPTVKGAAAIDPGHIIPNPVPPPVLIERVLLDGIPFAMGRNPLTEVRPGVKRLEIQYIALSLVNPAKIRYKYRLAGYEDQWIEAGNRRVVDYTNLDAGTYNFSVIACNNDGVWNEKGADAVVKVIAPLWKTWWFQVLALLLFAFLSYFLIHLTRKYITLSSFWKKEKYVGNFRLMDKLGAGGMGTVYKATSITDKTETVALKLLNEEMFNDESSRKRFKQEAAIIDQLDHPNIIKIIERGESRQKMFIAMEYLKGKTLGQKIVEEEQLDIKEALHIMVQIADALAKIHSKNIIHRDMKPENIMLIEKQGDPNFVKLLDFGLARTEYQTRLTQTGIVIGTINYLSPEQISGKGSFVGSDVYALGIIFYEMLTGEKPFIGETTIDIMKQIMDKTPIEPLRFREDIPVGLSDLVMRMLDKSLKSRPVIDDVLANLKVIQGKLLKI